MLNANINNRYKRNGLCLHICAKGHSFWCIVLHTETGMYETKVNFISQLAISYNLLCCNYHGMLRAKDIIFLMRHRWNAGFHACESGSKLYVISDGLINRSNDNVVTTYNLNLVFNQQHIATQGKKSLVQYMRIAKIIGYSNEFLCQRR